MSDPTDPTGAQTVAGGDAPYPPAPGTAADPTAPAVVPQAQQGAAVVDAQEAEASGDERTFTVRDQTFHLRPKLPGITMMKMARAGDASLGPAKQLGAVLDFLHAAIVPAETAAFEGYLESAEPVIEDEELNNIVQRMIEEFTGRPT